MNLKEKLEVIDKLEKLCATLEWTYSLDADGNPREGAVGKEEEKIRAWQIPKTTGQFLFFLINLLQPKHILELGTSVGYSALWMGSAAQQYGGHIDTIEYFAEKANIAKEYVRKAELEDTITIHKQKIIDFLHTYEVSPSTNTAYNFVFMDADKSNYIKYFEIVRQKAAPNCLIVVDNAGNLHHRMKDFIDMLVNDSSLTTTLLPLDNGLLLIQLGKGILDLLDIFETFKKTARLNH